VVAEGQRIGREGETAAGGEGCWRERHIYRERELRKCERREGASVGGVRGDSGGLGFTPARWVALR
jgi:hypothetical protein